MMYIHMAFSKKKPLHSTELFKIFFSLLTLSTAFLQKACGPGKNKLFNYLFSNNTKLHIFDFQMYSPNIDLLFFTVIFCTYNDIKFVIFVLQFCITILILARNSRRCE